MTEYFIFSRFYLSLAHGVAVAHRPWVARFDPFSPFCWRSRAAAAAAAVAAAAAAKVSFPLHFHSEPIQIRLLLLVRDSSFLHLARGCHSGGGSLWPPEMKGGMAAGFDAGKVAAAAAAVTEFCLS